MKHSLIKKLQQNGGIIIKPNSILENWFLLRFAKAANRYHQKVKLIDNDIFIGSLNSNNDYTGIKYGEYKYIDLNLYMKNSPCVNKVASFFINIVNTNNPSKANIVESQCDSTNTNKYESFLEETPPYKSEISDAIVDMLENAKESITIVQSYYMNIPKIEEILIRAIKRGVKVEIITAQKRDQLSYRYFLNEILFEKLLKEGASVYEFLDKSFHMKAYYVDNKILNMGSFNNDITSFYCNNEANYLIKRNKQNSNLFKQISSEITKLKSNSRLIVYDPRYRAPILNRYIFSFLTFGLWLMGNKLNNKSTPTNNI